VVTAANLGGRAGVSSHRVRRRRPNVGGGWPVSGG